jgi:hypothetical protein
MTTPNLANYRAGLDLKSFLLSLSLSLSLDFRVPSNNSMEPDILSSRAKYDRALRQFPALIGAISIVP